MSTMCYATQQYKMADTDQVYIHVATVHVPASHQIHKGNLSRLLDLIERMEIKYGSSVFTRRSACPRATRRSRSARRQGAATPSPAQTTALGRDRPGRVPRVHRRCNAHRPRSRSLDHAAYTCGNHRSLPSVLPAYAGYSLLRMMLAYLLSLVFTLIYGRIAATNRSAEVVLVTLLYILLSIPFSHFCQLSPWRW